MAVIKSITAIDHDDSEIDGLQQCLDYLSTYEDPPIPVRLPKRQTKHAYSAKQNLQEMPSPQQEELLMNDASSAEYNMGSDGSARSSIFSNNSMKKKRVEFELDDEFMDEVTDKDQIYTIDNVVTIVRKHDRWDPKKVSFVNVYRS